MLQILLDGLVMGDGHVYSKKLIAYYTSSKKLADDVQEIAHKCGYVASVMLAHDAGRSGGVITGREVVSRFSAYQVTISSNCRTPEANNALVQSRSKASTKCLEQWEDYDGEVFCLEVPDHVLFVRRNRHAVWCGNSWVPQEWIDKVMETVRENQQWNFLFLTKNPKRLVGIDFPDNCWVGTTVDVQERVAPAMEAFKQVRAKVKFLSCEPLQEHLQFEDMSMFDWMIVGGRSKSTGMPEGQPGWMWVEDLLMQARKDNLSIYFKPNLKARPIEYSLL